MKKIRLILALALTSIMVTLVGATASASPSPRVGQDTRAVAHDPSAKWLTSQVTLAQRAMKQGADGQVSFDANQAVALGADPAFVRDFAVGVSTPSAAALAACRGVNRYISHWWGPEGWLNSCVSNNVSILLAGGAAVATIIGAILVLSGVGAPAGAIAALATGLIGLGVVAVRWCNRDNTGIKAYKPGWVGPFVCTRQ